VRSWRRNIPSTRIGLRCPLVNRRRSLRQRSGPRTRLILHTADTQITPCWKRGCLNWRPAGQPKEIRAGSLGTAAGRIALRFGREVWPSRALRVSRVDFHAVQTPLAGRGTMSELGLLPEHLVLPECWGSRTNKALNPSGGDL
jgi:hypothetical protein